RPLCRWQLMQAAAAPWMRTPASRLASSGWPEPSMPCRKIASPAFAIKASLAWQMGAISAASKKLATSASGRSRSRDMALRSRPARFAGCLRGVGSDRNRSAPYRRTGFGEPPVFQRRIERDFFDHEFIGWLGSAYAGFDDERNLQSVD